MQSLQQGRGAPWNIDQYGVVRTCQRQRVQGLLHKEQGQEMPMVGNLLGKACVIPGLLSGSLLPGSESELRNVKWAP
jgi:hypothetical protein